MKKLPDHDIDITPDFGKPPKGAVYERITAAELGPEFFRNMPKNLVFKQTTPEDFDRIIAELNNEHGKV
ncbi:MAG TPA: hypothetical protein VFX55_03300 [Duganella sp.]|nr:hypothetical protein [Duganella sp.]